jgi:uncharacterized membrane protein YjjB (DUF3815 family)
MNVVPFLLSGMWAALFAVALAVAYGAPVAALYVPFLAAFAARFLRDLLTGLGLGLPLATVAAGLAASFVAVRTTRKSAAGPVAAITAILPLSPSSLIFDAIRAVIHLFDKDPAIVAAAATAFTTNTVKSVIIVAALAIGIAVPLVVGRNRF